MARVKFRTLAAGPGGVRQADSIHELPDGEAHPLVQAGYAFHVDAAGNAVRPVVPVKPPTGLSLSSSSSSSSSNSGTEGVTGGDEDKDEDKDDEKANQEIGDPETAEKPVEGETAALDPKGKRKKKQG